MLDFVLDFWTLLAASTGRKGMPSQEELVRGPVIHKEKKKVNCNILITYTTISTILYD